MAFVLGELLFVVLVGILDSRLLPWPKPENRGCADDHRALRVGRRGQGPRLVGAPVLAALFGLVAARPWAGGSASWGSPRTVVSRRPPGGQSTA